MRSALDRPRLVPADRLEPDPSGDVPRLPDPVRWSLRAGGRLLGTETTARAAGRVRRTKIHPAATPRRIVIIACRLVTPALRDSSLISTSVRMVHLQRSSDEKRPGRGHQKINPMEFATTGPRTPETTANYLLHRGLRQDGSGDQRGVSARVVDFLRERRPDPATMRR